MTGRNAPSYARPTNEASPLSKKGSAPDVSDLRQGNQTTLTALRQLRSAWATVLDAPGSPYPKEPTGNPSPPPSRAARSSGSDNGQISRFEAQGFATPTPGFEEPSHRGGTAQSKTSNLTNEPKSSTEGGAESRVTLKNSSKNLRNQPVFQAMSGGNASAKTPTPRVPTSDPGSPRGLLGRGEAPNLAAGWTSARGREQKLASGRVVTAHIPIHSPILDQAQNFQKQVRTEINLQLSLKQQIQPQGQQLAEFALRHAGHSMESLLKKAYRLDSRKKLSKPEALCFFTLILQIGGEFTFSHSTRVRDLALDLADEMGVDADTRRDVELGTFLKDSGEMGLLLDQAPPEKLDQIGHWLSGQDLQQATILHDIGKTRIPPEILYKPGKLSEEEYELMKLHPIIGEKMLFPIQSLRHLCPIVRGHHERWDGGGYPDGLCGQQIPLGARIIAIADVFDALVAERPYKAGLPVDKVRAILQSGRGSHFDPELSDAFGRVIQRRYPELGNPFD